MCEMHDEKGFRHVSTPYFSKFFVIVYSFSVTVPIDSAANFCLIF